MKKLDYVLQEYRYRVVEPFIHEGCQLLDIGGFDGSFLVRIKHIIGYGICIDPLIEEKNDGNLMFIRSSVDRKIPFPDASFDIVTMLAVYEHLGSYRLDLTKEISRVLRNNGLVVLTVPGHAVNTIVHILKKIRVIDGMSLEQHDDFNADDTIKIFETSGFKTIRRSTFQCGFNNLFVFKKLQ